MLLPVAAAGALWAATLMAGTIDDWRSAAFLAGRAVLRWESTIQPPGPWSSESSQ